MKKRGGLFLILIVFFILPFFLSFISSLPVNLWNTTLNGLQNNADEGRGIAVDSLGNIYVIGSSYWASASSSDIYLGKFNSSGGNLWNVTINGQQNLGDNGYGIVIDPSNNIYITGAIRGAAVVTDIYIGKFNSSGSNLWNSTINGPQNSVDIGYGITLDSSGNIYIVGSSRWSSAGNNDIYIGKFNSSGNNLWNSTINGPQNNADDGYGIALDSSNNIYIVGGSYWSSVGSDIYLGKFNSSGNNLWNSTINGPQNSTDVGYGLTLDNSLNIYVTGYWIGSTDIYLGKFNSSGSNLWNSTINGPQNNVDQGYGIKLDSSENIYVTGTISWGVGLVNDLYLGKFNSSGNNLWNFTLNGLQNGNDIGYGMVLNNSNIYIAGSTFWSSASSSDIYLGKFLGDSTSPTGTCNSCADCTAKILNMGSGDVLNLTTSIEKIPLTPLTCIDINDKNNITFDCQSYAIQNGEPGYGIKLTNTINSQIRNCNISNLTYGLYLVNSHNNNITNIETNNNTNEGINDLGNSNNTFNKINAFYNGNNGMFISEFGETKITNVNSSFSLSGSGIYLYYCDNVFVQNISVNYNYADGVHLSSSNGTNLSNIVSVGNSFSGIYLSSSNGTNLDNIFSSGSAYGVFLVGDSDRNNLNNIFSNGSSGGGNGIRLENSFNNNMTNITAINSATGIFIYGGNNSLSNANTSYNSQNGILLSTFPGNILNNITSTNNSLYGVDIYFSDSNRLTNLILNYDSSGIWIDSSSPYNIIDNLTANFNNNWGTVIASSGNNLTNLVANSNSLVGIYLAGGSNNNLINITANENFNGVYVQTMYNSFENLNIWNCSYDCFKSDAGGGHTNISNGKINLSYSGDLIWLDGSDYFNFSNIQLFNSGVNDINFSNIAFAGTCENNSVPSLTSCFDLTASISCFGYFSTPCNWHSLGGGGYCEFKEGVSSCFNLTSDTACDIFTSDCSWNSINGYCEFHSGLSDCGQIYDSSLCNSVPSCSWNSDTFICEGTLSEGAGCSNLTSEADCSATSVCIWDQGYCKDYIGNGGQGYFFGSCADISDSNDCNYSTSNFCAYSGGYCRNNNTPAVDRGGGGGEGFFRGIGGGGSPAGFSGSCSDILDQPACGTTSDLCSWLINYDYSLGNTFLNCSYNTTKENLSDGSQLTREWYYKAYVNDTSGNAMQNFNVTSFDVNNIYQFNLTTDATGFTPLATITDYFANGSSRYYSSPYTIYAQDTNFLASHFFNASLGNNYMDIFTVSALPYVPPSNETNTTVITPGTTPSSGGGTTCTYDWICSEWYPSPCPSDGIQKRVCVNRGTCPGSLGIPDLNKTCIPEIISPTEPLFDIFVNIPNEYKWIIKENQIQFNVELTNFGNATTIDVIFKYWIVDENGRLIGEKQETRAIGKKENFQVAMPISEDLPLGIYKIYVQITYGNKKVAIAEDSFEVVKTQLDIFLRQATSFPYVLAPFVLIIVILILIILIRKRKVKHKIKYIYQKRKRKIERKIKRQTRKAKRHIRKKRHHRRKVKSKTKVKQKIVKRIIPSSSSITREKLEEKQRRRMIKDIRENK